ncbi:MAG: hypothetical protein J0I09_07895 [Sphingobacteriia bacterium]|nr:hypothetical protein [Sphingobacteriia bacterium]
MKIIQWLSHPLMQIISFCFLLVGSPYFGGPFIFFLYHAFFEAYAYALIGMVAIVVTLVSLFIPAKGYLQLTGLILMVASLLVFFFSSQHFMNASVFREGAPLLTLVLFVMISIFVVKKIIGIQQS